MQNNATSQEKEAVRAFWSEQSCAEAYVQKESPQAYAAVRAERYALQPWIEGYAGFANGKDKDILEIGVGMGTDFCRWAESAPKSLTGIDLTDRALDHARTQIAERGLGTDHIRLQTADAENLPFADHSFDIVYSWGVLHHSPDTPRAITEACRVLRPGGRAVIMIYHSPSLVGLMLWVRYALLRGRFWKPLSWAYAHYLESPGTKAYSRQQARDLFSCFSDAQVHVEITNADLLEGIAGERRHSGTFLRFASKFWPRAFLRRFAKGLGNQLVVIAVK